MIKEIENNEVNKKEKRSGITLSIMVTTIILLGIISTTLIYVGISVFNMREVRQAVVDIIEVEELVHQYYIKHGTVPVLYSASPEGSGLASVLRSNKRLVNKNDLYMRDSSKSNYGILDLQTLISGSLKNSQSIADREYIIELNTLSIYLSSPLVYNEEVILSARDYGKLPALALTSN